MTIHRCAGNQDLLGLRDEAGIDAALSEKRLLFAELEPAGGRTERSLTLEEKKTVIGQACELGARRFILRGRSEPLRGKDTLPLVRLIRSRMSDVVLITNGRPLSKIAAGELAALGARIILRWPENRSAGAKECPPGLANLLEAGYPGPGRFLGLRIGVRKSMLQEIPRIWRFARKKGLIPSLERSWKADARGGCAEPDVKPGILKELAGRLAEIDAGEFGLSWGSRAYPSLWGCDRCLVSLAVSAEGEISPCLGMDLRLGNIRQTSLAQILRENPVAADLRNLRSGVKGFCRTCEFASACSGCRAQAFLRTGDFMASEPLCWEKWVPAGDVHGIDVERKLPHKDSMKLLRGTAWLDDNKIVLSMRVPRTNVFTARNGKVASPALVEMLAQLCAAQRAHDLGVEEGGRILGYLIGVDNARFRKPVMAGDRIELVAWNTFEMNEVNRVQGEIFQGAELAGQAELTVFKADSGLPAAAPAREGNEAERPERGPFRFRRAGDEIGRGIFRSIQNFHRREDGCVEAALSFAPGFIGFKGHFPGYPVLPGVVILYAGFLLAELGLEEDLRLAAIKRAKFLKPIHSGDPVEMAVRLSPQDDRLFHWFAMRASVRGALAAKCEIGVERKRRGPR